MEQLTPIDEEPSEDDANDEDQPITMIPKILHTAPSPTTDYPPTSNVTSTTTVNNEHHQPPVTTTSSPKLTSTGPITVPEILIEKEDETKQSILKATKTAIDEDHEVKQIESVL